MPRTTVKEKISFLERKKIATTFLYELLIGKETVKATTKFEVDTKDGGRKMAPITGRLQDGVLMTREGFDVESFEPDMIKAAIVESASDAYAQQFGGNIYSTNKKNINKILEKLEAEDLTKLKQMVYRTKLWQLAKLVTTGIFPTQDGTQGIKYNPDFSMEILTGDNLFSSANANIIQFLRERKLNIQKDSAVVADIVLVTPDVAGAMMDNEKFKDIVKIYGDKVLNIMPKEIAKGANYIGHIAELNLDIFSFTDWVQRYDPATKKFLDAEPLLPDGTLVMLQAKSFKMDYASFPFRETSSKPQKIFVGKEAVTTIYGRTATDPDLLEIYCSPLISPVDAKGWISAKVL